MSQTDHPSPSLSPKSGRSQLPDGIAKGIIGFVIGAGVSFLGMHFYGPREKWDVASNVPAQPNIMPPGGMPPGGMSGGGMGGGMPGGGMGGGMAGGGSGERGLAALIGKLELLSRKDLQLHVEIEPDQAAQVAAELEKLDAAKRMTAEEAQARLEALEALLTPEQKEAVDAIGTPFTPETSAERLKDLLGRLKRAGS